MKHLIKLTAMLSLVLLSTPALSEMMDCPSLSQIKNASIDTSNVVFLHGLPFSAQSGEYGLASRVEIDGNLWRFTIVSPEFPSDQESALKLYPKIVNKLTTKVYDKAGSTYRAIVIFKNPYCEYTGNKVLLSMGGRRLFWIWD